MHAQKYRSFLKCILKNDKDSINITLSNNNSTALKASDVSIFYLLVLYKQSVCVNFWESLFTAKTLLYNYFTPFLYKPIDIRRYYTLLC